MKRKALVTLLALSSAWIPSLYSAELNIENYSGQEILATSEDQECGPFSINSFVDWAGKADFEHKRCRKSLDNVEFGQAEVDANLVFYYDKCNKEGLIATAGYNFTQIKWKNPYFDQNQFNTASVAISGFTSRAENWEWAAQVKVNFDLNHFKWSDYIFFDMLLSGRYAYSECLGLHFGFIGLTGYRIDHLYPIIGIDWQINEDWKLNLVYPLDISLVYSLNCEWSLKLASRAFETRHRVGKDNHYSRGLVEYRATGGEFQIAYQSVNKKIEGDVHAGELLGGRVKASNSRHHHIKRYKFKNAPYVGGHLAVKF